MANWNDPNMAASGFGAGANAMDQAVDAGLRSYMLSVYNYMGSGVLLTGIVAMLAYNSGFTASLIGSPLMWVVMLAPLAFVLVLSFGINKLSTGAAQALFWVYAAVMGLSMSTIFLAFTASSIATTFFATAAAFLGLSLYGYTTKRSLSGVGSFLVMGLIGLIVASIVNIFLGSGVLAFAISVIGLLIFAGLTAWDTQRLKQDYDYLAQDGQMMQKASVMGALTLYLNFVNMFQFILSLTGSRE